MPFEKPTTAQLENRFQHHPPHGTQASRYFQIRGVLLEAAKVCVALTPCSPEQTRALNALDEAMMLFNAAIARNEEKPVTNLDVLRSVLFTPPNQDVPTRQ